MSQPHCLVILFMVAHVSLPVYSGQKHPRENQNNPRSVKRTKNTQQVSTQEDLDREFVFAAASGDAQTIISLIQKGAYIEATNSVGRTALHCAAVSDLFNAFRLGCTYNTVHTKIISDLGLSSLTAKNGYRLIIETLLSAGSNVHACDKYMHTPLHCAAMSGYTPDIITLLIKAGANQCAIDMQGRTPLHQAAYNNYKAAVTTLVKAGSDIEAIDSMKNTALHIAVDNFSYDAVEALIGLGANKDAVNSDGNTPLLHAIQQLITNLHDNNEDEEDDYGILIIRKLIESGADIMVTSPCKGETVPEMLCEAFSLMHDSKRKKALQELTRDLMNRYERDSQLITDSSGNTLFHVFFLRILREGQSNLNDRFTYVLLKKYGRYIAFDHKNMDGLTPLHVVSANPQLSKNFIDNYNANPRATTPCGDTAQSLAGIWRNIEPQPDWTPLMHTVHRITIPKANDLRMIKNALDACEDPEFMTSDYHSALSIAQYPEVRAIIRKHILATRRKKIFKYLQTNHNQSAFLADCQLQFAGTYEL